MSGDFKWVSLDSLVSPKRDIRTNRSELFIQKLMTDIDNGKLIEPLIVRVVSNEKYEVLDGETRHIALKRLKRKEAPVVIYDVDDLEASLIICKMAIMKRSYDPIGLASFVKYLNKTKKMKLVEIARELGYKNQSYVTKLNALNKLSDEDKLRVSNGELSVEMAYSIVRGRTYELSKDLIRPRRKLQCFICGSFNPEEDTKERNLCMLCDEKHKRKPKKDLKLEPQQTELS